MKTRVYVLCCVGWSGCYPEYVSTPVQSPVHVIPNGVGGADQLVKEINGFIEPCRSNLDSSRKNAYKLHKGQYHAGVFGSLVTLISGVVAGTAGASVSGASPDNADKLSLLSGGGGLASLAAGVVTLILVNKQGIKEAEDLQQTRGGAWTLMSKARIAYTPAVLKYNGALDDIAAKTQAFNEANNLPATDPTKPGRVDAATKALDDAKKELGQKKGLVLAAMESFFTAAGECGLTPGPFNFN